MFLCRDRGIDALYFGQDHLRLRNAAARSFVECFVTYETHTRMVTVDDEDDEDDKDNEGEGSYEVEEIYTVLGKVGRRPDFGGPVYYPSWGVTDENGHFVAIREKILKKLSVSVLIYNPFLGGSQ